MDNETAERLRKAGIDPESGIQRVAGNEGLFIRLLRKFPLDASYASFKEELEKGDLVRAEEHMHALKGVSANLSMTRLHPACQVADAQLKEGRVPENLATVHAAYADVVRAIETI